MSVSSRSLPPSPAPISSLRTMFPTLLSGQSPVSRFACWQQLSHKFRLVIREVLLLKGQRRPADSLSLEVEGHVDMVGDLDKRNTAVHPVVLTVEDHFPVNLA